jgi:hypothetical protein
MGRESSLPWREMREWLFVAWPGYSGRVEGSKAAGDAVLMGSNYVVFCEVLCGVAALEEVPDEVGDREQAMVGSRAHHTVNHQAVFWPVCSPELVVDAAQSEPKEGTCEER